MNETIFSKLRISWQQQFQVPYLLRTALLLIIFIIVFTKSKNYFVGLFFVPDRYVYDHPRFHDIPFEELTFPTSYGQRLHGFFFKPNTKPKGTIIHCHGNAANVTNHFPLVLFLAKDGFNVLSFDYQGYGQSDGKPSPQAIVDDTMAAIEFIRLRKDVDPLRIGLFGQSLGGAAAAAAMAKDPTITCLVLEGAFPTYRSMAWATHLGKLLFFLTPFVIPGEGPIKNLPDIAPRPILILHGLDDGLIPYRFAHELYNAASHKKSLRIIKGLHHLHGEEVEKEYQGEVLSFFNQHLSAAP